MTVNEFIESDWVHEPHVRDVCVALVDGLRAGPVVDHYTLGTLQQMAHVEDMQLVSQAALYLATSRIGLLEPSLMYEVNGMFIVVDRREVAEYSKGHQVVHPQSGMPMSDDDLFVVFLPGRALQNAAAE